MCAKLSKNSDPKRILVVSQTNIGDVVLTCPVLDILCRDFPQAKIDLVVGPKAVSLFDGNPHFKVKVFDKQSTGKAKRALLGELFKGRYDAVIDLRRTMLTFFLRSKYATPLAAKPLRAHKKEMHLNRLRQVFDFDRLSDQQYAILTTKEDEKLFHQELDAYLKGDKFVVIAPGAADATKRWHPQGFAELADQLSEKIKVVFVGDIKDAKIVADIQQQMKSTSISLAGKLNLRQLAYILKKSAWAITHDSGVMHLACYFNVPVIVLWGPTDLNVYAPWGSRSVVVRCNEDCERCQNQKSKALHTCMDSIKVQDVLRAVEEINL